MFDWYRRLTRVGKVAAAIGAVCGAVVGISTAWAYVEWAVPAHRALLRHTAQEVKAEALKKIAEQQMTTNELLIWKSEDMRAKAEEQAAGWNIQLQKEQDPQVKYLIRQNIERLKVEQRDAEERIRKLRSAQ
jgi:gas vesicle protein